MEKYKEALRRGIAERKKANQLQDDIISLFVQRIYKLDNLELLESIKKELEVNA